MELSGQVALVTGAGQGIGKAAALALAAAGADTVVTDINEASVQETAAAIAATGRRTLAIRADVGNLAEIDRMVSEAVARFGKIDTLVNNAGVTRRAYIMDLTEDDWDRIFRVNAKGVFFCLQRVARSAAAMDRDDLVAARIAQIPEIDLARRAFAPAGWILDALAAVGDAGVVECLDLLGAGTGEADGAAVGMTRVLAVDRLGDAERAGFRAIPNAALRIGLARRMTECAQHGVVEFLGRCDVVAADHDVREHGLLSSSQTPIGFHLDLAVTS